MSPSSVTAASTTAAAQANLRASVARYPYHNASPPTASSPCAPTTVRGSRVAETDSSYSMSQIATRQSPPRAPTSQVTKAANAMDTSHPRPGTTPDRCRIPSGRGGDLQLNTDLPSMRFTCGDLPARTMGWPRKGLDFHLLHVLNQELNLPTWLPGRSQPCPYHEYRRSLQAGSAAYLRYSGHGTF